MCDKPVPLNGKHLPYGFPSEVVKRALVYCQESKSVALGWRRLKAELEQGGMPIPSYQIVWEWVRDDAECYESVRGDKKRDMVAMSADVAQLTTERLIEALPGLSGSQMPIVYGIAQDKLQGWYKTAGGNIQAIQINIGGAKGEDDKF